MALSDYWKNGRTRQDSAWDFLGGGSNAYNPLYIAGADQQGCFNSRDCGSGFACVGGICVQKDTGAGDDSDGDPTGCGEPGDGDGEGGGGGGGGGCGPSTAGQTGSSDVGGCSKPGCGDPGPGSDPDPCCGKGRCCRFGSGGFVSCTCGDCPPPPEYCNKWCNDYLSANGTSGEGCDDDSECDECEECLQDGGNGYRCKQVGTGPCHCSNSSCDGECEECGEDGVCKASCANCSRCYRTYKPCPCGNVEVNCCYSACDETKGYTECRESANCDDYCPPPPPGDSDPCSGSCTYITVCDDAPPPCPPRSTCSSAGSIEGGGRQCQIIKVCDKSNVPDDCGFCDCNCEKDCPDCQICDDSTGKCKPDPACDEEDCNKLKRWLWTSTSKQTNFSTSYCDCVGVPNQSWNPGGTKDDCALPAETVRTYVYDGIGGFCGGTGYPADMKIKTETNQFTTYLSDFSDREDWCVPGPGSVTRTVTSYYGLGANACASSDVWGFLFATEIGTGYNGTIWVPPVGNYITVYNSTAVVQYSDCDGVFPDVGPDSFPPAPAPQPENP